MPVGRARIAPQAVAKGVFGFAGPDLEPDELGAAAEVQHHATPLVVTPPQPSIDRRVRVACTVIIVSCSPTGWPRPPSPIT